MEDAKATHPIRLATLTDVRFIDHLQRIYTDAVGFMPRQALHEAIDESRITLATENDSPAGYLLTRPKLRYQDKLASIVQAAVAMDAQRRHHGLSLLHRFELQCIRTGKIAIQACCAVGVEANEFWRLAGFTPIAHLTPPNKRQREVICWRKALTHKIPSWFVTLPPRSGAGARKTRSHRNPNRRIQDVERAARYISTHIRTTKGEESPTPPKGTQSVEGIQQAG